MSFRIVADSSINMLMMDQVDFRTVPMKILCGLNEYIDDKNSLRTYKYLKNQGH